MIAAIGPNHINPDTNAIFRNREKYNGKKWVEENIPREYKKNPDIARAFDALSIADTFFGRIRRWQYYRFYVYIYNLLSAGIAIAKEENCSRSTLRFVSSISGS